MNAIKLILKWIGIFCGSMVALMIGIGIIGHFQMKQEKQVAAGLQKHLSAHQVVSGMTPDQVRQAWGPPNRVTQGELGGIQVEQWFYSANPPRYDDGRYVGFREGKAILINAGQPAP